MSQNDILSKFPGSGGKHTFIVAEIGKNFIVTEQEEPVEILLGRAKALVDAAVDAGVDAVKFQTHTVADEQLDTPIVSPHFLASDRYRWVLRNTRATPVEQFWKPLQDYCAAKKIVMFTTPMSKGAALQMQSLDLPIWKVGSADVQDYLLLDTLASFKKPIIISTGMVSRDELAEIMSHLREMRASLTVLYCVSQYPCPEELFNLASIEYLKKQYPYASVGFSDHSIGMDASLAAIRLGAVLIEKHFSLSRDAWGPDHKVSLLPSEMQEFVQRVRAGAYAEAPIDTMYGDIDKEFEGAHNTFRPFFNKSLVVTRAIASGSVIGIDDLVALRPRALIPGASPTAYSAIVGKRAKRAIAVHEPIQEVDVQ
jgi:N,N'-diacetyllegionaminate synthase